MFKKKYNYIGYTQNIPNSERTGHYQDDISYILFCACGHKEILGKIKDFPYNHKFNKSVCSKCKGKESSKITLHLNSRLNFNLFKSNFKTFETEKYIKIVKFEDYIGVNQKSNNLFFKKIHSSLVFNKQTKRFFIYNSDVKNQKLISIGLQKINSILLNFFNFSNLESHVFFDIENKIFIFRNAQKEFVQPYNEFLNSLVDFIDFRDIERVKGIISNLDFKDLSINLKKNEFLLNLEIVISLIQYPNLSSILFNINKNDYSLLLQNSIPISNFKKNKDLSPSEIISNILIGKLKIIKKIYTFQIKQENQFENSLNLDISKEEKIKMYDEYIDFIKSNKFPKYIVKDYFKISKFVNENSFNIVNFAFIYYFLLYNNLFDKKEIISNITRYSYKEFSQNFYDYFARTSDYNHLYLDYIIFKDGNEIYVKNNNEILEIEKKLFLHFLNLNKKFNSKDGVPYYIWRFSQSYRDTFRMLEENNESVDVILKCKSIQEVIRLHDHWTNIYNLRKNEIFNEGIKNFAKKYKSIKCCKVNDVEFKLIDDIHKLKSEGEEMNHCVMSYAKRLSNGEHLIFSIKDLSNNERATLEFFNVRQDKTKEDIWQFSQLKAKFNGKANEKIIDSIKEFVKDNLIKNSIKVEVDYKSYDLQKNSTKKSTPLPVINNYNYDINYDDDDELPF